MIPALILDTNVLIAGLRSSLGASYTLISQVGMDRFTLGLTTALVLEYEAVCLRNLYFFALSEREIGLLLDNWCKVGRKSRIRFHLRPSLSDPGDEMVLQAAVATRSDWIVTHNIRHMAGAARYGVDVITPGGALRRLENLQ